MLEEEALENYMKASVITKKIMKFGRELVKTERSYLKIAEAIEEEMRREGGKPAFPVNVSANGNAAHDTPEANDTRLISESDLVKVDFGVMIEGYVTDTAFSYNLSGEHAKQIEAAELALQNALSLVKAGTDVRDLGAEIEKTIKEYGFLPVENLCGHSLEQYNLHAGTEIPNVARGSYVLKEGDVFAIEPFASTGKGSVNEGDYCQIYSLEPHANMSVRLPKSRELLTRVASEHLTMPFAARWFKDMGMLNLSLRDLEKQGILHSYPILKEAQKGSFVAQAETCLIVEKEGAKILV
ncbi:MAG: type II methionyl aminopeptidase [Candidatus Micrarchaeota archaeon]